jgi:hypothetical protein
MKEKYRYKLTGYYAGVKFVKTVFIFCLVFVLTAIFTSHCFADEETDKELTYDEVSVFLQVPRFGGQEIPTIIKNQEAYIAVADLFNFLKLKNTPSANLDSISGFFLNTENPYLIDKESDRIIYQGKTINLNPGDIIRTESNLYLKSNYFGDIFGLVCTFNFRALSITLNTKHELPAIKELKLEMMRTNMNILKREIKADTLIGRSNAAFKLGMLDWSVASTQTELRAPNTWMNLALGGTLAGGEANVNLNYFSDQPFTSKQQQYLWRYADNQRPWLRQVMAGKIPTNSISTLFSQVVGLQFTNTPTTYRRSFGTYRISNVTEPGWTVELYVNNVLIDYVKADASGFYKFEVPLIYGNTAINLRFYGPFGEERSSEQNIRVPFNFLPVKEFEYTVSAGFVEDAIKSKFTRASFNYGVDKRITAGGGLEYLSSAGAPIPFVNTSVNIYKNLLFSGEHAYQVRTKGVLTYRTPSNLQVELDYIIYDKNQKAINFNFLQERKLSISMPFQTKKMALFSRLGFNEIKVPGYTFTSGNFLISSIYSGVSTNLSTYAVLTRQAETTNIFSTLSQSYRLPKNLLFTPQIQYHYTRHRIASVRAELEKRFSNRSIFNIFYENNIQSTEYIGLGLRYDFSFLRTAVSARQGKNFSNTTQHVSGSLLYDQKTNYLGFNNYSSIGRGGVTIQPFLDVNMNGKRDKNESKLPGLKIKTNGGRVRTNTRDTTIQIFELEPYTKYILEIDKNSFENIAWNIKNSIVSVAIEPNQIKLVEVPVSILGETSGIVEMKRSKEQKGQGQITVHIYKKGELVAKTLSESDGYFSYMGLKPGSYTVQIDPLQLKNLKLKSTPESLPIDILPKTEGDLADGLNFVLSPAP